MKSLRELIGQKIELVGILVILGLLLVLIFAIWLPGAVAIIAAIAAILGLVLALPGFQKYAAARTNFKRIILNETRAHIEALAKRLVTPTQYVGRGEVEQDIRQWVKENETGFAVLVGEAGGGKTTLLRNLATEFLNQGLSVLFIEADRFEKFIAKTFKDESFESLVEETRKGTKSKFIIVLDTLDLIAYNQSLQDLILFLRRMRSPVGAIIIGSIRLPEYERLKQENVTIDAPFFLYPFSPAEIESLLKNLGREPGISNVLATLLRTPMLVHTFCEVFEQSESIRALSVVELFERYWQMKVERLRGGALPDYPHHMRQEVASAKEEVLFGVCERMFSENVGYLRRVDCANIAKSFDQGQLAYEDIVSEGILVEMREDVVFFHQLLFEYACARWLLSAKEDNELNDLIRNLDLQKPYFRGIIEHLGILSRHWGRSVTYSSLVESLQKSDNLYDKFVLINLMWSLPSLTQAESEILEGVISQSNEMLDYLLSLLISGSWRPKEAFARSFTSTIKSGNYEMKRRTAEALPFLAKKDVEGAFSLAKSLRTDSDAIMGTDIRRRVVEALPSFEGLKSAEIEQILMPLQDDEFYVIIATVEVLYHLRKTGLYSKDEPAQRISDKLSEAENRFVRWLRGLLRHIDHDKKRALREVTNVVYDRKYSLELPSGDDAYRIAVARNIHRMLQDFPLEVIRLMDQLLQPTEHKNVRRPLVMPMREMLDFLCSRSECRLDVEKIVWRLCTDKDEIIPVTFSDSLIYLVDVRPDLARKIIDHYRDEKEGIVHFSSEGRSLLLQRAEQAMLRFRGIPENPGA